MKVFIFLLILGASLFACDPKSNRQRSIPLRQLEKETFTKVDTTSKDSVDKFIDE